MVALSLFRGKERGGLFINHRWTFYMTHDDTRKNRTSNPASSKYNFETGVLQTNCHEGLIEVLLIDNPGPMVRNSCILQVFMTHILHESHTLGFFINWENHVHENGAEVLIGFERIFAQDVQLDVHLVDSPVTLSRQFAWVNLPSSAITRSSKST